MTDKNQGEVIGNWQGKMWETLWEVELAGYHKCLCLRVRKESFSFDYLEYLLLLFSCSVSDSANPWTAACQASLYFTISWSLLKLMSIESVLPFSNLILCCPLLLLPSVFPSIRVFSSESALCIRWPNYWRISISPSNEYWGLISFRIVWFDLLTV